MSNLGAVDADASSSALALVHQGWEHLRLQRPLAAWASWMQALRVKPDDPAATEALAVLADAEELPPQARKVWSFRSPRTDDQRSRWSAAFDGRDLADLDRAAEVFASLATESRSDSAALFNFALCLAWQGRNAHAIEALDSVVSLDATADFESAVTAWTLAEILRNGGGAEMQADDVNSILQMRWSAEQGDPLASLAEFAPIRTVPIPADPATGRPMASSARLAEWLDSPGDDRPARILTDVAVEGDIVRLSSPDRRSLEHAEQIVAERLGDRVEVLDRWSVPLPLRFLDAAAWRFRATEDDGLESRRAAIEHYYENVWITRPRIGLSGSDARPRTPVEAASAAAGGDLAARAKLSAIIAVREGLASRPRMAAMAQGYPFDRLRRRLGLPPDDASTVEPGDVTCMSRDELKGLDLSKLTPDILADAYEASLAVCDEATIARFQAAVHSSPSGPIA